MVLRITKPAHIPSNNLNIQKSIYTFVRWYRKLQSVPASGIGLWAPRSVCTYFQTDSVIMRGQKEREGLGLGSKLHGSGRALLV